MLKNILITSWAIISPINAAFWSKKPIVVPARKANIEVIDIENELTNTKGLQVSILKALRNPNIDGIILSIDSPGGSTAASGALESVIKKGRGIKPIVAFVSGFAFSGGYMAASAANFIICPEMCMVGSIGIIMQLQKHKSPKLNGDYKCDLDVEIISSSKRKGAFNPNVVLTEELRNELTKEVQAQYALFCKIIAENRGLDLNEKSKWAEAKSFNAKEALELGLIDKVGSIVDCEEVMLDMLRKRNPNIKYEDSINLNIN